MRTAIVTIGTELTDGDITNSNAAWLAARMRELAAEVSLHITVPDDRSSILAALKFAQTQARIILTTGGLGPTSDDFTADVIGQHLNRSMVFDEDSWNKIVQRLTSLGLSVPESNRSQCYFPAEAEILENHRGTANAFIVEDQQWVYVTMPGPPAEIAAIWQDHLCLRLRNYFPAAPVSTRSHWHCMGVSESALAELVEPIIANYQLKVGYRSHFPTVEVKIWSTEPDGTWRTELRKVIQPWLIAETPEPPLFSFIKQCQQYRRMQIVDMSTGGLLVATIVQGFMDCKLTLPSIHFEKQTCEPTGIDQDGVFLALIERGQNWQISLVDKRKCHQENLTIPPYVVRHPGSRLKIFLAHAAIYRWCAILAEGH